MRTRGQTRNSFFGWGPDVRISAATILKLSNLSVAQQRHLRNVYSLISLSICSAAFGTFVGIKLFAFPMLLTFLGILLFDSLCHNYSGVSQDKYFAWGRLLLHSLSGFMMGQLLSPLISYALIIKPAAIASAFFGTLIVFACSSIAAIYAKKRSFFFLGSILSVLTSYLMIAMIVRLLFGLALLDNIISILSAVISMGMLLFDTQLILDCHERGNRDYFVHASWLSGSIFNIFTHILIELLRDKQK